MLETSKKFKCIVWDLDNTLWNGVLLENESVQINHDLIQVIKALDERGILHSIASRNNFELAKNKLIDLNLWEYFIYPEIHWDSKSLSIENIAKNINIGLDSIAFVDDQQFELDEVKAIHPSVSFFQPLAATTFLEHPAFMPRFITHESAQRRMYYQSDIVRNHEEKSAQNNIEFLQTLDLNLHIKRVTLDDLRRAEELTLRTHQLNTTGITYSYEELSHYMMSATHELWCCALEDKYGAYGTIGLVLLEKNSKTWIIKLFLLSCRVMSRNVGNTLLAFISKLAWQEKVSLQADFIQNEQNRQMYITYKFNQFEEIHRDGKYCLLEFKGEHYLQQPHYVKIRNEL